MDGFKYTGSVQYAMVSFTYPNNWKCFEELCSKYPRNISDSKVFRLTVEDQLKLKNRKSNQDIGDFADKYAFDLESDVRLWKSSMKGMNTVEVRELTQLLRKRLGLADDELVKRTQ